MTRRLALNPYYEIEHEQDINALTTSNFEVFRITNVPFMCRSI